MLQTDESGQVIDRRIGGKQSWRHSGRGRDPQVNCIDGTEGHHAVSLQRSSNLAHGQAEAAQGKVDLKHVRGAMNIINDHQDKTGWRPAGFTQTPEVVVHCRNHGVI